MPSLSMESHGNGTQRLDGPEFWTEKVPLPLSVAIDKVSVVVTLGNHAVPFGVGVEQDSIDGALVAVGHVVVSVAQTLDVAQKSSLEVEACLLDLFVASDIHGDNGVSVD